MKLKIQKRISIGSSLLVLFALLIVEIAEARRPIFQRSGTRRTTQSTTRNQASQYTLSRQQILQIKYVNKYLEDFDTVKSEVVALTDQIDEQGSISHEQYSMLSEKIRSLRWKRGTIEDKIDWDHSTTVAKASAEQHTPYEAEFDRLSRLLIKIANSKLESISLDEVAKNEYLRCVNLLGRTKRPVAIAFLTEQLKSLRHFGLINAIVEARTWSKSPQALIELFARLTDPEDEMADFEDDTTVHTHMAIDRTWVTNAVLRQFKRIQSMGVANALVGFLNRFPEPTDLISQDQIELATNGISFQYLIPRDGNKSIQRYLFGQGEQVQIITLDKFGLGELQRAIESHAAYGYRISQRVRIEAINRLHVPNAADEAGFGMADALGAALLTSFTGRGRYGLRGRKTQVPPTTDTFKDSLERTLRKVAQDVHEPMAVRDAAHSVLKEKFGMSYDLLPLEIGQWPTSSP